MLPALNKIATQQSKPTSHTIKKCNRLLYYAATYLNTAIRCNTSDMILHDDTDNTYLILPKARFQITGYFYLRDRPPTNSTTKPKLNGYILTICQSLKYVVASAAGAEI